MPADQLKIILPTHKSQELDSVTGEFNQAFKKDLIPNLLKLFPKIEEEGTFPNSFFESSITNPDRHYKKIVSEYP